MSASFYLHGQLLGQATIIPHLRREMSVFYIGPLRISRVFYPAIIFHLFIYSPTYIFMYHLGPFCRVRVGAENVNMFPM